MRWIAVAVFATLGMATPAQAGITNATASLDGTVAVSASAEPRECENGTAQSEWEFQEPAGGQKGPRPPCGGHFAVLARAPRVRLDERSFQPTKNPCGKLPTITEFWNRESPLSWYQDLVEGIRFEHRNPPLRLAWMSDAVENGDSPQALSIQLHLKYGLWPGGLLETPCLYLVYLFRAEGSESASSCLPDFNSGAREELCAQQYWSEIWVDRLGKAYVHTAYKQCGNSQARLRAAENALSHFVRHHRSTRHLPRQLHDQWLEAHRRVEATCPNSAILD
jgi:hypothetical protein